MQPVHVLQQSFIVLLSHAVLSLANERSAMQVGFEDYGSSTFLNSVSADTIRSLLNATLDGYDVRIRPRLNQSDAVVVNVTFTPNSVVGLDTTEQRLDVLGFFTFDWEDELLAWIPDAFDGVTSLKLPLLQVWRPRAVIMKAFHTNNVIGNMKIDEVYVVSDMDRTTATVNWMPEGIYSVLCDLDVTFYPFDIQDCNLQFYIADETYYTVYLNGASDISVDDYSENSEWKLLSVNTGKYVSYNTNIIYVSFKLERRAEFSLYTIMMPLLFLSILVVFGFLIPTESGEKISYMVTLFLTFGFFVFILRDSLPHNSVQLSYFLVYLMELSIVSVVSVIYSILQTSMCKSHGEKEFKIRLFHNMVSSEKSPECPASPAKQKHRNEAHVVKPSRPIKNDKTINNKGSRMNDDKGRHVRITWSDALRKLDYIMFFTFIVLVFLFTMIFFGTVLNR